MFYFKTIGIILHKKNVKEKSAIIYILVKNLGIIKAVAEGINTSKSKILSIVQPGNFGKFYLIGEPSVYKLISFLPYKIPFKIYKKYPYTYLWALRFLTFFNFLDTSDEFLKFLTNIDKILLKNPKEFSVLFIYRVLTELGIQPNLENCEKCNINLQNSKNIYLKSSKLYCDKCKKIGYEKIEKEDYLDILNFLKDKKVKKNSKWLSLLKKILKSHLKRIHL
jgi:recombinational DNA repair protein (RecF pathway)